MGGRGRRFRTGREWRSGARPGSPTGTVGVGRPDRGIPGPPGGPPCPPPPSSTTRTPPSRSTVVVVGPVDNNVYIVRCRSDRRVPAHRCGQRARQAARAVYRTSRRAPGGRDPRALGPHPGRGGRPGRRDRRGRHRGRRRTCSPPTTSSSKTARSWRSVACGSGPSPPPGHTPGSMCFTVEGTPLLFTGDTLFPGGPGNTKFENADFATIIRVHRGPACSGPVRSGHHGAPGPRCRRPPSARETPHLAEWIERGW